jgi:probable phosphoglycerate mutase
MQLKNLITIQHCQSEQHLNGMVGGATDWPLTELGLRQADCIGAALSEQIQAQSKYKMYASDLTRARQTAEIIAQHLHITPIYRANLREQNFGSATGKSKAWFRANMTPCPHGTPLIYHKYLPDAETGEDVLARVSEVLHEIEDSDDENVIVVGHGGSLQMFAAAWLKIPIAMQEHMAIVGSAGGVSFFLIRSDGVRVLNKWNDLSFADRA